MKTLHKQYIRSLIMEVLYDDDIRYRMNGFLDDVKTRTGEDIDEFEAMEAYEQEIERINKMFCYPQQSTQDDATTVPGGMS